MSHPETQTGADRVVQSAGQVLNQSVGLGADDGNPIAETPPPAATPRYALGDEIARGGMGVIYRATDNAFGREVAVKVLHEKFAPRSGAAHRFADEARITGQLQHPAIPPAHDLGTLPDGRSFLAMKLIKGRTLEQLLNDEPDRGRLIAVFEQICQAIAYAHAHDVIHRDLKPANVMVGSFGEVQVMDWGLAKVLGAASADACDPEETMGTSVVHSLRESDGSFTQAGSVLGTPAYMPPEQALGAVNRVDARSDVFGLGAVLAVILTGKPPFAASSSEETRILAAQGRLDACFARLDACGADPELVDLCKHCLNPNPGDRPPDGGAVAKAIAELRNAAVERARQAELDRVKAEGDTVAAELKAAEHRKWRRVQAALGLAALALAVVATAVAFRFFEVEREQRLLAGRNGELAADNATERDAARAERRKATDRLIDQYVLQGVTEGRSNDPAAAALWFIRAASAAVDDPERRRLNVIRAVAHSRAASQPAGMFKVETLPDLLIVHPTNRWVLSVPRVVGTPVPALFDLLTRQPVDLGKATAVAWSADGSRLATGYADGRVCVERFPGGGDALAIDRGSEDTVLRLVFSADGVKLAVGGDNFLQLFDAATGQGVGQPVRLKQQILTLDFEPKGQYAVAATSDDTFHVLDCATGAVRFSGTHFINSGFDWSYIHPQSVSDGKSLVTVSNRRKLALWDVKTGRRTKELEFANIGFSLTAMPDDTLLLGNGSAVTVIGATNLAARRTINHPTFEPFDSMALVPFRHGKTFLRGGGGNRLDIADRTGQAVMPAIRIPNGVRVLGLSPDESLVAACEYDQTVRVWRLPAAPVGDFRPAHGTNAAFAPGGEGLVTWNGSGPAKMHDLFGRRPAGLLFAAAPVHHAVFRGDGRAVVTFTGPASTGPSQADGWNPVDGDRLFDTVTLPGPVVETAAHPDGRRVAVRCKGGEIVMLDAATGKIHWQATARRRGLDEVRFRDTPLLKISPDGLLVIVAGGEPPPRKGQGSTLSLVICSAATGTVESRTADLASDVQTAALSEDGQRLGVGGFNSRTLHVWDTRTGARAGPDCEHPNYVLFVTFSPDGRLASTYCMDWQVRTWEVETGKLVGPPFMTHAMSRFTPDGRYLVAHQYSPVPTVGVWDWKTGQPVLPERRTGLAGAAIWAGLTLAVSPDGRRAACGPQPEVRLFGLDDLHDSQAGLSLDDLTNYVELQSFRTVHEAGTLAQFTGDQWRKRWDQFLIAHPDGLPVYDHGEPHGSVGR